MKKFIKIESVFVAIFGAIYGVATNFAPGRSPSSETVNKFFHSTLTGIGTVGLACICSSLAVLAVWAVMKKTGIKSLNPWFNYKVDFSKMPVILFPLQLSLLVFSMPGVFGTGPTTYAIVCAGLMGSCYLLWKKSKASEQTGMALGMTAVALTMPVVTLHAYLIAGFMTGFVGLTSFMR